MTLVPHLLRWQWSFITIITCVDICAIISNINVLLLRILSIEEISLKKIWEAVMYYVQAVLGFYRTVLGPIHWKCPFLHTCKGLNFVETTMEIYSHYFFPFSLSLLLVVLPLWICCYAWLCSTGLSGSVHIFYFFIFFPVNYKTST